MTRTPVVLLSFVVSLLYASTVSAAPLTWDNGGTGMLWNSGNNWNPDIGGAPASIDTITFNNTGTAGTAGATTNIVNTNVTVTSLSFDSTANFHTTEIIAGQTLTVSGGNMFLAPGGAVAATTHVTFKGDTPGAGTFTYNAAAFDVILGRNSTATQNSTLDASGLGTMNMTANQIDVGLISATGGGGGAVNFNLAASNNITADQLRLGGWNSSSNMRLGTANILNIDSIEVGWNHQNGAVANLLFNTGLTNPTVTIRNKAGTGRAALLAGWGSNGAATGTLNFTGGNVDALFSTVILGQPRGNSNAGNGAGTITFNAGTIDATTIVLGRAISASTNASSIATGTINVNGGILIADQIQLADVQGPSQAQGFLNIAGGTVQALSIAAGPGAGVGTAVRRLNFTNGTLTHKVGTDLTVTSAIDMRLLGNGLKQVSADAGRTVTINANIQNSGGGPFSGLTKVGAGTLLLNGTNTYTGSTLVSAGTLGGVGAATSDFTIASGATLSPGNSPGTLYTDDLTMQAGSNLLIEIGGLTPGTQHDQVLSTGAVSLSGNLIVSLINGFNPQNSDTFTIIDGASVIGEFSSVSVIGGLGYFQVVYTGDQVLLTNYQLPEPSTLSLLGMATLCLISRHRRRLQAVTC